MQDNRDERFHRYSAIVSPATLIQAHAQIVGVGAIGRQVALQLATMGVGQVTLVDFDTVERVNLGPQGYHNNQIGEPKTGATAGDMIRLNPAMKINQIHDRFDPDQSFVPDALFSCVDCMDARRQMFDFVKGLTETNTTYIDSRMSASVIHTMLVKNEQDMQRYEKTLFSNDQAHPEPCTRKSTIYTASIAAGLAINLWVQSLSGVPALRSSIVSLNSMDWSEGA